MLLDAWVTELAHAFTTRREVRDVIVQRLDAARPAEVRTAERAESWGREMDGDEFRAAFAAQRERLERRRAAAATDDASGSVMADG